MIVVQRGRLTDAKWPFFVSFRRKLASTSFLLWVAPSTGCTRSRALLIPVCPGLLMASFWHFPKATHTAAIRGLRFLGSPAPAGGFLHLLLTRAGTIARSFRRTV